MFVNPKERNEETQIVKDLVSHHGQKIVLAEIAPVEDALLEHLFRVDIEPFVIVSSKLPNVG